MLAKQLAEHIILNLRKTKHQLMSFTEVKKFLEEKLKDEYSSELSIAVKGELINSPQLDFFKEGTYIDDFKYYFSAGNWIATKGKYDNPIEAKSKMHIESWMEYEGDDRYLD